METTSLYYNQSYRALFFDEIEEYEEFIDAITNSLKKQTNSHTYNNLGLAYIEIGNFENGLDNLNFAIELNPKNATAFLNRAELNNGINQHEKAKIDFGKAIELKPKEVTFWRTRAHFRKEIGELDKALSDLQQAIKLEPNFQGTINEIIELENRLKTERKK